MTADTVAMDLLDGLDHLARARAQLARATEILGGVAVGDRLDDELVDATAAVRRVERRVARWALTEHVV